MQYIDRLFGLIKERILEILVSQVLHRGLMPSERSENRQWNLK